MCPNCDFSSFLVVWQNVSSDIWRVFPDRHKYFDRQAIQEATHLSQTPTMPSVWVDFWLWSLPHWVFPAHTNVQWVFCPFQQQKDKTVVELCAMKQTRSDISDIRASKIVFKKGINVYRLHSLLFVTQVKIRLSSAWIYYIFRAT